MDERVAMAISHWAPRFTMNGVTAGDFERITSGLERWDGLVRGVERGRAPSTRNSAGTRWPRAATGPRARTWPRPRCTTTSPSSCSSNDLDQMRTAHRAAVRCLDDALPYLDPPGQPGRDPVRRRAPGRGAAPPPGAAPHPVVIMIPGLDSAKEELRSTEELFLERGMATFSVDGPGQGEAEYDLAIRGDWEVPGAAIIDRLGAEPGLDPGRIGVWGVSLGGYYAPRVASGDDAGAGLRRAGRAVQLRRRLGQPPEPDPGGVPGPVQVTGHGRRPGGRPAELSLAGRAELIRCPLLAVMGKLDRLIPWQHAGPAGARRPAARPSCCCWSRATTAAPTWRRSTATGPLTGSPSSSARPGGPRGSAGDAGRPRGRELRAGAAPAGPARPGRARRRHAGASASGDALYVGHTGHLRAWAPRSWTSPTRPGRPWSPSGPRRRARTPTRSRWPAGCCWSTTRSSPTARS